MQEIASQFGYDDNERINYINKKETIFTPEGRLREAPKTFTFKQQSQGGGEVSESWSSKLWAKWQGKAAKKESKLLEEADDGVSRIIDARIFKLYRDKDDSSGSVSISKSLPAGDESSQGALSLRDIIARTSKYNG
mmetsp:Transcript_11868/g.18320  ORF Transcript_11868/g.18320 Transcript_11868/m.18320 type:complete len:136 (+) Transcript_11868:742-1149(+)